MTKFLFFVVFLHFLLFSYGQNINTISINAKDAYPLKLSEIADKVTPIILEEPPERVLGVIMTNEYLFVASISSIVQYDLSGRLIRIINCGGMLSDNITSDTIKKELYAPVKNKIKCYDYSGNLKKEYSFNSICHYCLYHKGFLWVQFYTYQRSDQITSFTVSRINLSTGKETILPFERKKMPEKNETGGLYNVIFPSRLTLHNDEIVANFHIEDIIYKIQQDKVIPFIKWNFNPSAKTVSSGFSGDYLYIKYFYDRRNCIYLKNMKTGKIINANEVIDDVFNTSENCKINSMEQKGYFYFIKLKDEIKGNKVGNITVKNGPVVFIVKTK